ncbi:MAG: hypothetical protein ABEJ42_03465 [Halobacteriaceae archaeon]
MGAAQVASPNQGPPAFGENSRYRRIRRGDPVKTPYTVTFGNGSVVTVVFSHQSTSEGDYFGNVTIEDTDGNGVARLHFNSWEVGHANPWEVENGTITRWDQVAFSDDAHLMNKTKSTEESAYTLKLARGSDPQSVTSSYSSTARLRIQEAETEGVNAITAPGEVSITHGSDLWVEEDDFADQRANFSGRDDPQVAIGDTLILAPWGGGFWGPAEHALDVADGNSSAALLWLLENGYYNVTFNQDHTRYCHTCAQHDPDYEPKEGPGHRGKVLDVQRAVALDAISFVSALRYRHVVFALDTDAAVFQHNGSGEYVAAEPGDRFTMSFAKRGRTDHEVEPNAAGTIWDSHANWRYRTVLFRAPRVFVAGPRMHNGSTVVEGTTTLAPGTRLTVNVSHPNGSASYVTGVDRLMTEDDLHRWNVTTNVDALPGESG